MKKIILLALLCIILFGIFFGIISHAVEKIDNMPETDIIYAEKALEKQGYIVNDYATNGVANYFIYDGISVKSSSGETVLTIIKFEDLPSALGAYFDMRNEYNDGAQVYKNAIVNREYLLYKFGDTLSTSERKTYEYELKKYENLLEDYEDEHIVGIWGKTVWFGSKDAIEDSYLDKD